MAKKKKKRKKRAAAPAPRRRRRAPAPATAPAPRRRAAPVPAPVLPEPTEEPGEPFELEMEVMDAEAFPEPAAAPALAAPALAAALVAAPAPRRAAAPAPAPQPAAELPPEVEEVEDEVELEYEDDFPDEPVDDTADYAEQVEAQQVPAPTPQPAPAAQPPARGYRQPVRRAPAPQPAPVAHTAPAPRPAARPAPAPAQLPAVAGGALAGYAIARNPGQTASVVALNAGPRGLQFSDLDRVKIPTGGAQHWEIPGVTGPEAVAEWTGVVIHFRDERRYWDANYETSGGGTPPDCWSRDSITGHGTPGGACDDCPLAQWGTAGVDAQGHERPGQACRVARVLFVIRPNEMMPIVVSLPPTSIKGARQFFLRLGSKDIPFYAVEVKFGLTAAQSGGGLAYSQAILSATQHLQPEDVLVIETLREQLLPALEGIRARDGDFQR